LSGLGVNPRNTGLSVSDRREKVLALETLRLAYHHKIAKLGQFTLIAPEVSSYLSETSGAYILDTMGLGRKGKSPQGQGLHPHDLVNMFEVKENQRAFANIDITFFGTPIQINNWIWIQIDQSKTDSVYLQLMDGHFARVTNQINGVRGCTIQRISKDGIIQGAIAKTRSSGAQISKIQNGRLQTWIPPSTGNLGQYESGGTVQPPRQHNRLPGDGLYVRLSQSQLLSSDPGWFILRQESGNVNLSDHTGFHHAQTLTNGLLYVSRHRDVFGRYCVSFIKVQFPSISRAERFLQNARSLSDSYQFQPYLFADNVRNEYFASIDKSIALMGGELLAHYIETDMGLEEAFWDPSGQPLTDSNIRQLLLTGRALMGRQKQLDVGWEIVPKFSKTNQEKFLEIFLEDICDFYRNTREYTDQTNTARNIWTGKESEHLTSLRFGIRGDRSTAKGIDVIEHNGQESEVKQVTAQRGDAQFTMDPAPPINQIDQRKGTMKRLYIGRFFDKYDSTDSESSSLHIKLQYINIKPTIAAHISQYFAEYPKSPNFQYHSDSYETNYYGSDARNFTANVDFEYIENEGFLSKKKES
jgi:hypothetical protein